MDIISNAVHTILTQDTELITLLGDVSKIYHGQILHRINPERYDIVLRHYMTEWEQMGTKRRAGEVAHYYVRIDVFGKDDGDMFEVGQRLRYLLDRRPHEDVSGIKIRGTTVQSINFSPDEPDAADYMRLSMIVRFRVVEKQWTHG